MVAHDQSHDQGCTVPLDMSKGGIITIHRSLKYKLYEGCPSIAPPKWKFTTLVNMFTNRNFEPFKCKTFRSSHWPSWQYFCHCDTEKRDTFKNEDNIMLYKHQTEYSVVKAVNRGTDGTHKKIGTYIEYTKKPKWFQFFKKKKVVESTRYGPKAAYYDSSIPYDVKSCQFACSNWNGKYFKYFALNRKTNKCSCDNDLAHATVISHEKCEKHKEYCNVIYETVTNPTRKDVYCIKNMKHNEKCWKKETCLHSYKRYPQCVDNDNQQLCTDVGRVPIPVVCSLEEVTKEEKSICTEQQLVCKCPLSHNDCPSGSYYGPTEFNANTISEEEKEKYFSYSNEKPCANLCFAQNTNTRKEGTRKHDYTCEKSERNRVPALKSSKQLQNVVTNSAYELKHLTYFDGLTGNTCFSLNVNELVVQLLQALEISKILSQYYEYTVHNKPIQVVLAETKATFETAANDVLSKAKSSNSERTFLLKPSNSQWKKILGWLNAENSLIEEIESTMSTDELAKLDTKIGNKFGALKDKRFQCIISYEKLCIEICNGFDKSETSKGMLDLCTTECKKNDIITKGTATFENLVLGQISQIVKIHDTKNLAAIFKELVYLLYAKQVREVPGSQQKLNTIYKKVDIPSCLAISNNDDFKGKDVDEEAIETYLQKNSDYRMYLLINAENEKMAKEKEALTKRETELEAKSEDRKEKHNLKVKDNLYSMSKNTKGTIEDMMNKVKVSLDKLQRDNLRNSVDNTFDTMQSFDTMRNLLNDMLNAPPINCNDDTWFTCQLMQFIKTRQEKIKETAHTLLEGFLSIAKNPDISIYSSRSYGTPRCKVYVRWQSILRMSTLLKLVNYLQDTAGIGCRDVFSNIPFEIKKLGSGQFRLKHASLINKDLKELEKACVVFVKALQTEKATYYETEAKQQNDEKSKDEVDKNKDNGKVEESKKPNFRLLSRSLDGFMTRTRPKKVIRISKNEKAGRTSKLTDALREESLKQKKVEEELKRQETMKKDMEIKIKKTEEEFKGKVRRFPIRLPKKNPLMRPNPKPVPKRSRPILPSKAHVEKEVTHVEKEVSNGKDEEADDSDSGSGSVKEDDSNDGSIDEKDDDDENDEEADDSDSGSGSVKEDDSNDGSIDEKDDDDENDEADDIKISQSGNEGEIENIKKNVKDKKEDNSNSIKLRNWGKKKQWLKRGRTLLAEVLESEDTHIKVDDAVHFNFKDGINGIDYMWTDLENIENESDDNLIKSLKFQVLHLNHLDRKFVAPDVKECLSSSDQEWLCPKDFFFEVSNTGFAVPAHVTGSFDCKKRHKRFCEKLIIGKVKFLKLHIYKDLRKCCDGSQSYDACGESCQKHMSTPTKMLGIEVLSGNKYVICKLESVDQSTCFSSRRRRLLQGGGSGRC
eukprot:g2449.t1